MRRNLNLVVACPATPGQKVKTKPAMPGSRGDKRQRLPNVSYQWWLPPPVWPIACARAPRKREKKKTHRNLLSLTTFSTLKKIRIAKFYFLLTFCWYYNRERKFKEENRKRQEQIIVRQAGPLRFIVRFCCKCWSDCGGLTEDEPLTQATGFPPHRPIQKHFVLKKKAKFHRKFIQSSEQNLFVWRYDFIN